MSINIREETKRTLHNKLLLAGFRMSWKTACKQSKQQLADLLERGPIHEKILWKL